MRTVGPSGRPASKTRPLTQRTSIGAWAMVPDEGFPDGLRTCLPGCCWLPDSIIPVGRHSKALEVRREARIACDRLEQRVVANPYDARIVGRASLLQPIEGAVAIPEECNGLCHLELSSLRMRDQVCERRLGAD